ncbi:MAG: helix-turn-helix transcriptional regulator [Oscillospiraceae bacterium]|nr:helix-turn-helix transcriptional regulator [Oscillospiraceae bacterium]MCL2278482.1 helix-turn-helix transcriptional regulator [Oscillospiraceae bacterium]
MSADSIVRQKIRQYRKIHNITQEELAEEIGITPDYVSSIESGRRGVSIENLKRICEYFRVSMADILPIELEDESELKDHWISEINDTLRLLDIGQLGLVRTMFCSLKG